MWSNNRVYSWGRNDNGQLGNGSVVPTIPQLTPEFIFDQGLKGLGIISVAAGNYHSLALDSKGRVYFWGQKYTNAVGPVFVNVPIPELVGGAIEGKKIVQIAAGDGFSVALDEEGQMYSWGYQTNADFRLGVNNVNTIVNQNPVPVYTGGVLNGVKIVQISTGGLFALALDSKGKIYSWGENNEGQLGDGTAIDQPAAVAVDMSAITGEIIKISAGGSFGVTLDKNSKLYSWGRNLNLELGDNGATIPFSAVPLPVYQIGILSGLTIVDIQTYDESTLVLDKRGYIYSWGGNSNGQLGIGNIIDSGVPVLVIDADSKRKTLEPSRNMALSRTSFAFLPSSSTSLLNNSYYGWGYNSDGQIGNGGITDLLLETKIPSLDSNRKTAKILSLTSAGGDGDTPFTIAVMAEWVDFEVYAEKTNKIQCIDGIQYRVYDLNIKNIGDVPFDKISVSDQEGRERWFTSHCFPLLPGQSKWISFRVPTKNYRKCNLQSQSSTSAYNLFVTVYFFDEGLGKEQSLTNTLTLK